MQTYLQQLRNGSLFSRFKRDRSNTDLYKNYSRVRNTVQRDIKLAKETFFKDEIARSRGNSEKLWSHLKSGGSSSNVLEHWRENF